MALRLHNTLTGKKEELKPLHPPKVTLYVCGVTVYDDCHIGHARGAVVFDVLRRFLESPSRGWRVTYVRNITDVDDKIIDRARLKATSPQDLKSATQEVARRYEESFRKDFGLLGLIQPSQEPRATEFIPKMIDFIQILLDRGMAYEGSDGVYFSVRKIQHYGKLSHQSLDEMKIGVRSEPGEGKTDPLDFALWKKAKDPIEPAWESPWGAGRPGWHIECSTMSTALLGDTFDIHGGGQDLIFPHHENEIAQAEGAGKSFAQMWLHNGLLTVGGQKMAKSLGNIVTIREVLEGCSAEVLRLFFLGVHYRAPLDFNWELLERQTEHAYDRLADFLSYVDILPAGETEESREAKDAKTEFYEAMDDDLNTPKALSVLYELVSRAIPWLENAKKYGIPAGNQEGVPDEVRRHVRWLRHAGATLRELAGILGLSFQSVDVPMDVEVLVQIRDEARRKRDYATSDRIRVELMEQGYIVEDTAGGTVVRKRV